MKLTAAKIERSKPLEKTQKLFDGGGLFLEVPPSGSKRWRLKYRFNGREKLLSMGIYPEVGLKVARERTFEAKKLLASGADPSVARQSEKRSRFANAANTFEAIAREWYEVARSKWTEGHSKRVLAALERDIFPFVGSLPVQEADSTRLLPMLRKVEERGAVETAHRCQNYCRQVFEYALATKRCSVNHAIGLHKALKTAIPGRMAAITDPVQLGEFLRAAEGYRGSPIVKAALELMPHVMLRPGNLRRAQWDHIDVEGGVWRIPTQELKRSKKEKVTGEDHIVPLSKQSIAILKELHPLTGQGQFVFPGARDRHRPMSDNAILSAMRAMAFSKEEVCGHGFRSTASTLLNERSPYKPDLIEAQLAHIEPNKSRGAYMRAKFLADRAEMMQWWSDFLDECKAHKPRSVTRPPRLAIVDKKAA